MSENAVGKQNSESRPRDLCFARFRARAHLCFMSDFSVATESSVWAGVRANGQWLKQLLLNGRACSPRAAGALATRGHVSIWPLAIVSLRARCQMTHRKDWILRVSK